jgi:hypothetical protein
MVDTSTGDSVNGVSIVHVSIAFILVSYQLEVDSKQAAFRV